MPRSFLSHTDLIRSSGFIDPSSLLLGLAFFFPPSTSFHASHSNRCLVEITLHEKDTQVVEHAVRILARKPLVFQSLAPSLCLPVLYRQISCSKLGNIISTHAACLLVCLSFILELHITAFSRRILSSHRLLLGMEFAFSLTTLFLLPSTPSR